MSIRSLLPKMLFTVAPSRLGTSASLARSNRLVQHAAVITAEAMESRLLFVGGPTATLTQPAPITGNNVSTQTLVVQYSDQANNVAISSINGNNLTVVNTTSGQSLTISPTVTESTSANAAVINATYTVQAPNGMPFSSSSNGSYSVATTGNVTDAASPPNTSTPATIGNITVNVAATGPTATLVSAPNITTSDQANELVTIAYVDTMTPVQASSLTASNITVRAPDGGFRTVSGPTLSSATNSPTITATYTVTPSGTAGFTFADSGTYSIALTSSATDTSGNPTTAVNNFATFNVQIINPAAPVATLISAPTVTNSNSPAEPIVIRYVDTAVAINPSTLNTNDITALGSGVPGLTVVSATPVLTNNNHTAIVTYEVTTPNGTNFGNFNNITYDIGLTHTVANTNGDVVTAVPVFGNFSTNIPPGNQPPAAVVAPPTAIASSVANSGTITVAYIDNDGQPVLRSSITTAGLGVFGNGQQLPITGVSVSGSGNASTLIATYTVGSPTGANFTSANNGQYNVSINSTVTDTSLAAVTAVSSAATLVVNVNDTTSPTASINSAPLTQGGSPSQTVIVTYADDVGILNSTINKNNITVTAPDGTVLPVSSESFTASNSTTQAVTYTVRAPAGTGSGFTSAENGVYTVGLAGGTNAVTDTAGNRVASSANAGSFTIDIADNTAPQADISAPDVTTVGVSNEQVTVVLTDDVAIDTNSIRTTSLQVTDPRGNVVPVSSVTLDSTTNGPTRTATFTINAPGGTFTNGNNGQYALTLNGISDTSGHLVSPATATGFFFVDVAAPVVAPVQIGQFGTVNGKNVKLRFKDTPDGTTGVLNLKGGTGTAYLESNGTVDLVVTDDGTGARLNVTTTSGGPVTINNVTVTGTLTSFQAPTANVVGTFFVSGTAVKASFRHLIGTFATAGAIGSLTITRAVTGSQILSGISLGADGTLGGGDDTYGAGYIGKLTVGNGIVNTVVAAGDNPGADGIFGTSDDRMAGTTQSQIVQVIATKGFDTNTTKFIAGAFGKFKIRNGKPFVPTASSGSSYVFLT